MGGGGGCNYSEWVQLRDNLQKLSMSTDEFAEAAAKELAARLLRKVIKDTLPGQYPPSTGKIGGTLRRGWTSKTEEEAKTGSGNGKPAMEYAKNLEIRRAGNTFMIEVINPVSYASYVEYGHRTRDHKGWTPGKFVLTMSEDEIRKTAPAILERKLAKYLGEYFK